MRVYKVWLQGLSDDEYNQAMDRTKHMWNQSIQIRLKYYFDHFVVEQKKIMDYEVKDGAGGTSENI